MAANLPPHNYGKQPTLNLPQYNYGNNSTSQNNTTKIPNKINGESIYFSNGYQPKYLFDTNGIGTRLEYDGDTLVKDTPLKGSKNTAGKSIDNQHVFTDGTNRYVWIGNGNNGGYYVQLKDNMSTFNFADLADWEGSSNANNTYAGVYSGDLKPKDKYTYNWTVNTVLNKPVGGNTNTGSGNIGYTPPNVNNTDAMYQQIIDMINDLKNPPVYSANEIADIYDVDYNYDNILKDYNDATNKYYQDFLNYQDSVRSDALRNNLQYNNNIMRNYLDTYNNAAPTASNKGILAANMLRTQLGNNDTMAQLDSELLDQRKLIQEAYKAELANNPNLATQHYNNLGLWLSDIGVNLNESDVKQYVDQLDALSQMYAAGRSFESYLAQAEATKYSGLLNASVSNAQTDALDSAWYNLYNYYLNTNGGNSQQAWTQLWSNLANSTGKTN